MPDSTVHPQLSAAKRSLLAQWKRGEPRNHPAEVLTRIKPRQSQASAPLSFGQQQLWFFDQLQPESALYNVPISMRLEGKLDQRALQQAFNAIVVRHEILRTTFVLEESELVQRVNSSGHVPLEIIDLRDWPEESRQSRALQLLTEQVRRPFDLTRDPMLRVQLIRSSEAEWHLAVVMHHIASDVWSWRVLCRELTELYESILGNRAASLPELPIQYGDYAAWQVEHFRGAHLAEHQNYWRQKLEHSPGLINLPHDRPRLAIQSFEGACECLKLPEHLGPGLEQLSRSQNATLFMTLAAAFHALLHRYTGQADILVASPTAGRTRLELENLIGNFVNTVVLRTRFEGNPSFPTLLQQTREVVLEALAHQELPFGMLVQQLRPERSASHLPLVQVLFAVQEELSQHFRLPGVIASPLPLDSGTAKFDLSLTVIEGAASLTACAEYNSHLFKPNTVQSMLKSYGHLLEEIVSESQALEAATIRTMGPHNEHLRGKNPIAPARERPILKRRQSSVTFASKTMV